MALLDSGSKVNAMSPVCAKKLGFKTQKTNIEAQKIEGSTLKIFGMVIADFQVEDKGDRPKYFQEIFLMANTKFEMVLGIPFLKISNNNIAFGKETLTWKSYTTSKALPTIERVWQVNPKEFVRAALDADSKTFIMHVAIREQEEMPMHSERQAQIEAEVHIDAQGQSRAQVGALIFNKAPTKVPAEYSDYSNVFLAENIAELS